jgi:glycosyltransferase involved in cell wall biosynthesis
MMIAYLPLEPYKERYTDLLGHWTETRFRERGVYFVSVLGERLAKDDAIRTGLVLDAHGRSYWSLTQMAALTRMLANGATPDVVYFDDLFTPGYEALPYILDQSKGRRPRVYVRNHAQSVDPDDFVWPMRHWMRPFETAVYRSVSGVFCSSTVHKEMMEIAGLDVCPIHVIGHPYDERDVLTRAGQAPRPWSARMDRRVLYSSRFDAEKQPHFFMDVVEEFLQHGGEAEFVVCTGSRTLRSNDPTALTRAERLQASGKLRIVTDTTKAVYYGLLAGASVQLNTARQDFVSYTAIEASTLGTPTLAPAFRSFPEAFRNRRASLYVPWSVEDACARLHELLDTGDDPLEVAKLSLHHHGTLDRIIDLFEKETAA